MMLHLHLFLNLQLHLGFGFRCGFLGLLHMEIIQERLDREFDMDVITTVPNVSYKVYYDKGGDRLMFIILPACLLLQILIVLKNHILQAQIITKSDYVGSIMNLCIDKRGTFKNQVYLTSDRVEITFEMPLVRDCI